jgi:hypothetical protein
MPAIELSDYWLVMDMDGTIVPTPSKAGGHYIPLNESPCCEPLRAWLRHGGNLCIVSTAGRRMWRQVHAVLKPDLVRPRAADGGAARIGGRLLVSGFSGAAVFQSNSETGDLTEDVEYRETAVEGGTCPSAAQLEALIALSIKVIQQFLLRALDDDSLVKALSKKYHAPYHKLLDGIRAVGADAFFADVLTREAMLKHGAFLHETNDALVDVQIIPGTEAAAQVTTLGIPMARFAEFFPDDVVAELRDGGVHVKPQPNSVCMVREGIDKATLVRWLAKHRNRYGEPHFELRRAIAFGDNPSVVDKPLTWFPEMPFVSLAPTRDGTPAGDHVVHVGGEEEGCAAFLTQLMAKVEEAGQAAFTSENGSIDVALLQHLADQAAAVSAQKL